MNQTQGKPPARRMVYDWIKGSNKIKLKVPSTVDIRRIIASTVENIQSFFNVYSVQMGNHQYQPDLIVVLFIQLIIFFFF
jgi:hypothetical protein